MTRNDINDNDDLFNNIAVMYVYHKVLFCIVPLFSVATYLNVIQEHEVIYSAVQCMTAV